MKEKILVCRQNPNGTLTVLSEKKLTVELDESAMELYAKYQKKSYKVHGDFNAQYIIVEGA